MEIARGLIAIVAVVTAAGGLCADYFIEAGARQHLANPAWPPHAKFHNAQAILMGFGQGVVSLAVLFVGPLTPTRIVLAAIIASLYWVSLMFASIFPGTYWVDPEFDNDTPRPLGLHPQQLIGYVLLAVLVAAIALVNAP